MVNHNIERRPRALALALRRAARVGASMITLQEVCHAQVVELREQHPRWSIAWHPDSTNPRCASSPLPGLAPERAVSGNVAIWTGGRRARATRHVFRSQADGRTQGLACLHWKADGVGRHLCSTHLINTGGVNARKKKRLKQARVVRRITQPWVQRLDLVVIGGDFNASPLTTTLDQLYRHSGRGHFIEATACPGDLELCRLSRATTFDGGRTKIDYVFFSRNRVSVDAAHNLRIFRSPSDHHVLNGWAMVDLSPHG